MPPFDSSTVTLCRRCIAAGKQPCKANLLRLHDYWEAKRDGRPFPARADIDPLELRELLPNIFIIEVLAEAPHFRYRLSGSKVDEIHGQNLTGKSPRDIKTPEVATMVEDQYRAALADRRPRCDHVKLLARDDTYWHYERLILPLSDDGQSINMFLGGIYVT